MHKEAERALNPANIMRLELLTQSKRLIGQASSKFWFVVERTVNNVGNIAAWLVLVLVTITIYDVVMRYLFKQGSVAIQELEWHLFAAIFLLGSSSAIQSDQHVRVDVFYKSKRISEQRRALIDLLGCFFLLLPFCAVVIWSSLPFVMDSFIHQEISPDPGGLHYRWVIKALIPLGFLLLLLSAMSELRKRYDKLNQD